MNCLSAYRNNIRGPGLDPVASRRHARALDGANPHVMAIKSLVLSLACYADAHRGEFKGPLSEDSFLGPEWHAMTQSALALLNGPTGDLDCGTVDRTIRAIAKEAGFDGDAL